MYRRAFFHIGVLLLIVLVGSAVAQQLTGSQLLVSGSGPHAIGGATDPTVQLFLKGTSTASQALYINSRLQPAVKNDGYLQIISGTIDKAASGTHADFIGLRVQPPTINAGAATLTNASTVKITGAPSEATNNYALWVAGGTTQLGGLLHVQGDVQVDGNIAAKYQDVAEWVRSEGNLPAAAVVVIDPREPNRVTITDKAYDTRVAGVVSLRPGLLLGEGGENKAKVALSGRVKVKVDAQYGAIAVGDLLVTSQTPGSAMRSEPIDVNGSKLHRPGTLIGKALEPLERGQGEILVLLTLQ